MKDSMPLGYGEQRRYQAIRFAKWFLIALRNEHLAFFICCRRYSLDSFSSAAAGDSCPGR
jgi:hypothetical protein